MPRPGTPTVHPALADHLRPTVEAGLPDEGILTRSSTTAGTFNESTGMFTPAAAVQIFDGHCRVEARPTNERVVVVGGEPVTVRTYDVALPVTVDAFVDADGLAGVQVDDVFTVTVSESAFLLDRPLRVIDVSGDTVDVERRLVCEDHLG